MLLYINGNYPYHSLHSELVFKLAEMGNEIIVFVPMRGKEKDGVYRCNHPSVKVIYCDCLNHIDRALFVSRTHKIVKIIKQHVDLSKIDCILAGTVYSDGAAAYYLSKEYNIPFSVAVRETDVAYQMRFRPYLNSYIKRLLDETSNVIFLAPAYKNYFNKFNIDESKYVVIPNAVNDFWFRNQNKPRKIHDPLSLIYVGEISTRKNVETTIAALIELDRKQMPAVLHVVGSGDEEEKCRNLAEKLGLSNRVFFHGWQKSKEKIRDYYNMADVFVMPSLRETFGTVYIEALSQGLPVIYSRGQGIDGYFSQGTIGYSCNPQDVNEIASAIVAISENYTAISAECFIAADQFQWDIVAAQYNRIISDMRKA